MSDPPTWYELLGVAPSATAEEIRNAHRAASKAAHPDAGGSAERFGLVQRAYEVLADPDRRAAYDRQRRGERRPPAGAGPSPARAAPRRPPVPRPSSAPPAPEGGCLTPWVIIGAGVVVVVAVLVTIATLSSTGPSTSPATRPSTPLATAPNRGPAATDSAPPTGAVSTSVLSDLPAGFPRGHVPLPTSARLTDVVVASAPGASPTFTLRASGSGTDAERAALNYATTLRAAGWTEAPAPNDQPLPATDQQRSFVDGDGSTLRFVVGPADEGGLAYLIGFSPRS